MYNKVFLYREDYQSYYAYRKAIKVYRDQGYFIRNVYGGVVCFANYDDLRLYQNQK